MKCLHDRWRSLPAVTSDQISRSFEGDEMLLCIEAITACAALGWRDQAASFVVAHLLNADVSLLGQIYGTQIATNCHVKPPFALRDFSTSTRFFIPHRTSKSSLNRTLSYPYPNLLRRSTLQLGICVVQ